MFHFILMDLRPSSRPRVMSRVASRASPHSASPGCCCVPPPPRSAWRTIGSKKCAGRGGARRVQDAERHRHRSARLPPQYRSEHARRKAHHGPQTLRSEGCEKGSSACHCTVYYRVLLYCFSTHPLVGYELEPRRHLATGRSGEGTATFSSLKSNFQLPVSIGSLTPARSPCPPACRSICPSRIGGPVR